VAGGNFIMRKFVICMHHQTLLGYSNEEEWDGWGM
jgi:hypothetical protein